MTDWKSNKYWRNRPVEERLKNLRIPPRYKNSTFANYDVAQGSEDFKKAIDIDIIKSSCCPFMWSGRPFI